MPVYQNLASREGRVAPHTPATAFWVDGARLSVGYLQMAPGAFSLPHYHHDEQFLFIARGTLRAAVGGEVTVVPAGGLLHLPPGVVHELAVEGEEPLEFFVARSPGRLELDAEAFPAEGKASRSLLRRK